MSDDVCYIYVVNVHEGAYGKFKELTDELMAATRKEAGTVTYHFATPDGGRSVYMLEHYKNSAAFVSHVQQTFSQFADRMQSMARTTSVTVYGNPDAAARKIMDQWGALYMTPIDGFFSEAEREGTEA